MPRLFPDRPPALGVLLVGLLASVLVSPAQALDEPAPLPRWKSQSSATPARFRGLAVVDDRTAWASGTSGTVIRTTDGGTTWNSFPVPGASELDLRDVEAFDARHACVLSIGKGGASRIYRTADGGLTWSLRFTNPDADGFLDALAFWDDLHGLAMGDPVGGHFRVFLTEDGGASWHPSGPSGMPPARPGEGAFAASGTCLFALKGTRNAWFATGGEGGARVFSTVDAGRTWSVAATSIAAGNPSTGIFSVAFRDPDRGVVIGGDYKLPDQPGPFLARSSDGGKTWGLVENGPRGFRSAIVYAPGASAPTLVTVGPGGSDLSRDDANHWTSLGTTGFHALGLTGASSGWAVGDGGRVARLREAR